VVYPREGHRFTAAAQADAGLRAVAFLERHV
jgi:dipeptidyl aminopeptidase/acylaminoacyl peptidase